MTVVAIPPEWEAFVADQVASGQFRSADDVISAALGLMQHREGLRSEIAAGLSQIDSGNVAPFDAEATLARVRAKTSPSSGSE